MRIKWQISESHENELNKHRVGHNQIENILNTNGENQKFVLSHFNLDWPQTQLKSGQKYNFLDKSMDFSFIHNDDVAKKTVDV